MQEKLELAKALAKNEPAKALEIYKELLAQNQQNAAVYAGIAELLLADNQHQNASEYFTKAIELIEQNELLSTENCAVLADLENKLAFCLNDAHLKAFRLTKSMIFSLISSNASTHIARSLNASGDESFSLIAAGDEYLISYINALKKEQNCASIAHSFLQNAKEFLEVLNKPFCALACSLLGFWLTPPNVKKNTLIFLSLIFLELGASDVARLSLKTALEENTALDDNTDKPQNYPDFLALALRLQAAFALQGGGANAAFDILEPVFSLEQNFKNHLSKANIFLAKKDFLSVKKELELAKTTSQNSQNPKNSLAQITAFESFVAFNEGDLLGAKSLSLEALKIQPRLKIALLTLSLVAIKTNDDKLNIFACKELLKLNPYNESAWINLSGTLHKISMCDESIEIANKALCFYPKSTGLLSNLATAYHQNKQIEKAISLYEKVLEIDPNMSNIFSNLSGIAADANDWQKALEYTNKALQISPKNITMLSNKAKILIELQTPPEQIEKIADEIDSIKKDLSYELRGYLAKKLGKYNQALKYYKKAFEVDSNNTSLLKSIGGIYKELSDFENFELCYKEYLKTHPNDAQAYSHLAYTTHFIYGKDEKELFTYAKNYGKIVESRTPYRYSVFAPKKGRLKVGFCSGDFRNHPVGYFIDSVIPLLDKSKFELFAYTTNAKEDELTARLKPHFEHYKSIYNKSAEHCAKLIHDDEINILIDLSGHIALNALETFAFKPAPVQASWIGYWASTGLEAMDYVVGDPIVSPPSEAEVMVERIWNLPNCFYHFSLPPDASTNELLAINPEPPCVKNGFITFGSFNNLSKMNEHVVALWSKILKAVPNSKLFLKYRQLNDNEQKEHFCRWFGKYGVSADRLILEGQSPRYELLNAYNRVDLALDPFPYHGTTTTAESVMMGVGVLTLKGYSYLTRIGETSMINSGLAEFIANDENEYFSKAISISKDIEKLSYLRVNMREYIKDKPVFDTAKFAKDVEAMLEGMWSEFISRIPK